MTFLKIGESMNDIEDVLDNTFGHFEQGLNIAGYIPLVSSLSGGLRFEYGKLEIIGALAAAAIMCINALFNSDASEKAVLLNKAGEVVIKYSLHGVANMVRGLFEIVPFVSLVTCLPYDLMGSRFAYIRESSNYPNTYYIWQIGSKG